MRDFVGYGSHIPQVRWPNDAKVVVSVVINYEEGAEYSKLHGDPNQEFMGETPYAFPATHRDLGLESIYEYGSRVGIWRLFRLLDEYNIKASVFAAALAIELNPEVGEWIRAKGHEPVGHGWRWNEPWLLTRDEEKEQIQRTILSLTKTCGQRPRGWYWRYAPSVNSRTLLVEEGGFIYDSNAYNDDLPYFDQINGQKLLIVPYSFTYNDSRFVLAPGYGNPNDFAEYCKAGLDELLREGQEGYPKMMSIGLHPRITGQAGRTAGLRTFLDYAMRKPGVLFLRRIDIAEWWIAHYKEFRSY
ncbi:MAG: carbohydrate esterase family 4 protein [Acidomyces sp. 'richmondensis']|nr:MAG: carbohydrate esterase family 4 protein [Acidomyces sp. 'richmondensis']